MGLFDFLKKKAAPPAEPATKKAKTSPKINASSMGVSGAPKEDSDDQPSVYNRRVKVAGVTYSNPDGTSRQKILRDIYNKKPPFDSTLDVQIEEFEHKGAPAYYVKVNEKCIGTVEKEMALFISSNKSRLLGISDFRVDYFLDEETEKTTRIYYAKAKILVRSKK